VDKLSRQIDKSRHTGENGGRASAEMFGEVCYGGWPRPYGTVMRMRHGY
jgi:hypothetical protein